ncbi:hypothetical protein LXA43DRAFT_1003597 [Ganoderma leucocontextum]|nr:hypothetical protein LXA43DRAFT_1003597 [Ganoderma leucocontextum]
MAEDVSIPLGSWCGGADFHDGRLMPELCVRQIAHCGVDRAATTFCPREFNYLIHDLIALPGHTTPYHIFSQTSFIKTRALAMMVWKELRIQTSILQLWGNAPPTSEHGTILNSPLFPYISIYADTRARVDFLPPIVIRVACWMATFNQARYGLRLDARKLPMFAEHAYLPSLWKVQGPEHVPMCGGRVWYPGHQPDAALSANAKCASIQLAHSRRINPLTLWKHRFVHRYACRRSARCTSPRVEDDGDPADWLDTVETYKPRYDDDGLAECLTPKQRTGRDLH